MGRHRREIYSGMVYEICMRTRRGIPFVRTRYMKMLLRSVIARVQRDGKVRVCHHLWMGNHPHIIVVAQDKRACTQFYGEVQKQLTDAVKRLLGLKHLNLWKNNATSVIPYYDLETVCYRIAYLYANPARAHLVETIAHYPGLSSYEEFLKAIASSSLSARYSTRCPWVQAPAIPPLPKGLALTRQEDRALSERWEEQAVVEHELIVEPNLWMKSFGVTTKEEIEEANRKILHYLTAFELEAEEDRRKLGRRVMGRKKLTVLGMDFKYEPKKPSQRIFVYSMDKELRVHLIQRYRAFCARCTECYERWKLGDFSVVWPEGALLPPPPPTTNYFPEPLSNVY